MKEIEKYSFKMVLKECLKKINLEEIKNNEVILSNITAMLGDMCNDTYNDEYNEMCNGEMMFNGEMLCNGTHNDMCDKMSRGLLQCCDSNERYEQYKSKFINELEEEFNKGFKIHVTDERIVIEQTYIEYESGKRTYLDNDKTRTINKQVLEEVSSVLKRVFGGCNITFNINTYKLIYDKKLFKTFYFKTERNYEVSNNFVSNKPVLNIYDVAIEEEYNKNYEMISDKKYTLGNRYSIEDDNFIDNIKYSDAHNNDEKQEFITGGDITQCNFKYCNNEYSFILPTSRDAQIIDYIDGDNSYINVKNLKEHLDFIAMCHDLYDENPVVGITYVYSVEFLENVRDIKQDYEDKIGEKIGREITEKEAKRMGLTLEEYLSRWRT